MNAIDDCVHNRVISAAVIDPPRGRLLIVLDGGEVLEVFAVPYAREPEPGADRLTWRYETNPHPRTLLGLGAPSRPRGGHGRPLEGQAPRQSLRAVLEALLTPELPPGERLYGERVGNALNALLQAVQGGNGLEEPDPDPFDPGQHERFRWSASVIPLRDPLNPLGAEGCPSAQVRITGHASGLVPDGVYERVSG